MTKLKELKSYWPIIAITLFALLIRIYFFNTIEIPRNQDSFWLLKLAKGIPLGKYQLRDYHLIDSVHTGIQPLYPLLVASLSFLTGDYLFSGKLIALVFGVLTVPATYLLWKELESREVAIFTSFLVAVNPIIWEFSVFVNRKSLFLFFCTLSLFLLYRSRNNPRNLPYLALSLGIATLSRHEGYFLTLISVLTLIYWKRSYLSGGVEIFMKQWKVVLASFLIYVFLTLPWQFYKTIRAGAIIPLNIAAEMEAYPRVGLKWFSNFPDGLSFPIFLFAVLGVLLSCRRREDHLPFYLFFVILSIPLMLFHASSPAYAMPLYPLALGYFSISLFEIIPRTPKKIGILILVLTSAFSLSYGYTRVSSSFADANTYEVVKEAMIWFNLNTDEDASILVGDSRVYEYYADRLVYGVEWINAYNSFDFPEPLFNLLIDEGIHYYIPYDSLTPFLYEDPKGKEISSRFIKEGHIFDYVSSTLVDDGFHILVDEMVIYFTPLEKFENRNQTVLLYRVDWEQYTD